MKTPYSRQRHLDIYFQELAEPMLPDPNTWPQSKFKGYFVCFGKREVAAGGGSNKFVRVHKDDVAAVFQPKTEDWGVKVKFRLELAHDRDGTAHPYWEFVTCVYRDISKTEDAYLKLLSMEGEESQLQ